MRLINMPTDKKANKVLDCRGMLCPEPVLETKKAINSIEIGNILEVLADDKGSVQDIPRWAKRAKQEFLGYEEKEDGHYSFLIKRIN
jgi:tRNA 2-thiouridine synthesizing protein A